jgi:RNA polymerase sigma factor (sigma-70 family)
MITTMSDGTRDYRSLDDEAAPTFIAGSDAPPANDDRRLLARFADQPEAAWRDFLARYGSPMLHWLQRREGDVDAARDRWVEVCERLAASGYRRLRELRLDPDRPSLWPWLQTLMNRGAINALWARWGHTHVPIKVRRLGADEVLLYQLIFVSGGATCATLALAARRQPGRPLQSFMLAWERLQQSLDARDRGRLLALHLRRGAQTQALPLDQLADHRQGPAEAAELAQLDRRLCRAIGTLDPRLRLAIQLRFEQELPHAAIGAVLGIGESGARHLLRDALQRLHAVLTQGEPR